MVEETVPESLPKSHPCPRVQRPLLALLGYPCADLLLCEALEESEAVEDREEVARGHIIPCMYRPRDRAPTLANLSFDFQPTAHGIPEAAEAKGLPLSLH